MSNGTQSNTTFIITPTSLYGYIPTRWICITFIVLFSATTIIHLFQALFIRPRKYWIIPTLALCGIGEIIGWSGRLWDSINSRNDTAYLIQITTTIIAPVFLTAALYNILAIIIRTVGEEYSRLKPKTYLKIFVTIDVISLVVQAAGGGLASGSSISTSRLGSNIILAGIIFQLVALLFFTVLAVEVIYRLRSNKPLKKYDPVSQARSRGSSSESIPPSFLAEKSEFAMPKSRINLMIIGLSIATVLVVVRSFYRTAELADGWHGIIIRTQIYFDVFDATPIVLALFTLNLFSPAFLLRS